MVSGQGGYADSGTVRAVVLARHRPTTAWASEGEVHLLPLPLRADDEQREVISALCGTKLRIDHLETVTPGDGQWCATCFISHVTGSIGSPLTAAPMLPPDADSTDTTTGRLRVGATYQRLGWPVTIRRQEVALNLGRDVDAVALAIPTSLATKVTAILIRRRCLPPVLAHPAIPTYRIIIAGEPYPVPLGWPTGVHRITSTLLLPPTVTDRGPVCWVHPPVPDALKLCREVDVITALRAALDTSPPPGTP